MPKIPGVNHLRAIKAFEKAGFRIVRHGKHFVMSDGTHFITIPRHNPVNAITMGGIAKDAGLTINRFKETALSKLNARRFFPPISGKKPGQLAYPWSRS
jgi:predicted RNA binding protein YcfA (HicA-like mRNA interferase family)